MEEYDNDITVLLTGTPADKILTREATCRINYFTSRPEGLRI
jgi:hypothetical protein